ARQPSIGTDLVPHLTAQHLPGRDTERAALQIPQGLLESCKSRHEHGTTAKKTPPISDLPDVLDRKRVRTDEAVAEDLECAFDRFSPSFEACFAPAEATVVALNADE